MFRARRGAAPLDRGARSSGHLAHYGKQPGFRYGPAPLVGSNRPAWLEGFAASCLLEAGTMAATYAFGDRMAVVARTPATVYRLSREPFLTAVLGHAPTHRQAARIADARLATDTTPTVSDTPGTGTTEPS